MFAAVADEISKFFNRPQQLNLKNSNLTVAVKAYIILYVVFSVTKVIENICCRPEDILLLLLFKMLLGGGFHIMQTNVDCTLNSQHKKYVFYQNKLRTLRFGIYSVTTAYLHISYNC